MENLSLYGNGRPLIEFPRISEKSKTPLYGVKKLKKPIDLPLLVTGNGRSGTNWLSVALTKVGVDCRHERCGAHGTVSWYFFADSDWSPYHINNARGIVHVGERRGDFNFANTVHLTRHPLKAIGSIAAVMSMTDHRYVVDNSKGAYPMEVYESKRRLHKAMFLAHTIWNSVDKDTQLRMQIENVPAKWPALMSMLRMDKKTPVPEFPPRNKSRGIYLARTITYADMEAEDALLSKSIAKLAKRFGYL